MTLARPATPEQQNGSDGVPSFATAPVAVLATALAALLTAFSGRYGYHRDELYFLVAGDRPAWGYVDQPPLTPLLARASTTLFGETPAGLRVVATLLGVAAVVLVALVARELGGGHRAQVVAAGCAAASGIVLALGHMVSTATFDLFAGLLISWLVLRLLRTGDGRWYLPLGAVVGVGMLNKHLVLLLVLGLVVSLLVAGPRRVLGSWWLAAGTAVATVVAAPNLWWQATHGWPQLTVAGGISADEGAENRMLFVFLQLVYLSPLFVPIWGAGLIRLWRSPAVRWARSFAVAYPLLAAVVLVIGGKPYYVLPLLLVVTAAGAEPAVRWARTDRRVRVLAGGILVAGLVNVVATLPVLPPTALSVVNAVNSEQGEQVGWPTLVATVAEGWEQVPAGQRARAVIVTQNYGEAAAIARYGPRYGLPPAYSGHMSYHHWGPPPESADGPVLLVHYPDNRRIQRHFTDCRPVARVDNGYGLDNDEQGTLVQLCSGRDAPWSTVWPSLRRY